MSPGNPGFAGADCGTKMKFVLQLTTPSNAPPPAAEAAEHYGLVEGRRNSRSRLRPTSLRGPFCRYDLIGGLAGEFRHVVEFEGEAADARRGGAHLDDE